MKPIYLTGSFLIGIALIISSCAKENTKENYQQHVLVATDAVLAHQTLAQLTLTYLKGIHDSILLADNFVEKDGAFFYLTQQGNNYQLEIKYTYNQQDEYDRWRNGIIMVTITGGLHEDNSVASFNFNDFYLDQNPFLDYTDQKVSAGSYSLRQLPEQDGNLRYEQTVESFGFNPDTLGSKIFISDLSTVEWVRAGNSTYYNPADQVNIMGSSEIISKSGELVKSDAVGTVVFAPSSCIYFRAGEINLKFEDIKPDAGRIVFRTAQSCEQIADLEIDDLPFLVDLIYPYHLEE
jgi:hypothetical protein